MIKETCVCGAIFETDSPIYKEEVESHNRFTTTHKICKSAEVKNILESKSFPVTVLTPEDSKRVADTLIEQINTVTYQMQLDFQQMTYNITSNVGRG